MMLSDLPPISLLGILPAYEMLSMTAIYCRVEVFKGLTLFTTIRKTMLGSPWGITGIINSMEEQGPNVVSKIFPLYKAAASSLQLYWSFGSNSAHLTAMLGSARRTRHTGFFTN